MGQNRWNKDRDRKQRQWLTPESLEPRIMLHHGSIAAFGLQAHHDVYGHAHMHGVYAPGTSKQYMAQFDDHHHHGGNGGPAATQPIARWTSTATDGFGISLGDSITLTWSVVPDGTIIQGEYGNPDQASDFVAFMESLYGTSSPGDGDFTNEPWFPVLDNAFDRWSDLTGITYVYEANDDGTDLPNFGSLGVRGDVRVGGTFIDGNSGILAYNYYPSFGDMVFDTSDAWYSSNSGLGMRNVISHEAGHGIGLAHVESSSAGFLMEPFVTTAFDGPQFDDILGAQRNYGDNYETASGDDDNDSVANAVDLGALLPGSSITIGEDADDLVVVGNGNVAGEGDVDFVSIDDDSDTDYFEFLATDSGSLTVTVTPLGLDYQEGSQGGSQSLYQPSTFSDLRFEVFAANGTTSLTGVANANSAGAAESATLSVSGLETFFIKVNGANDNVQMYELDLTLSESSNPPIVYAGTFPNGQVELYESDGTRVGTQKLVNVSGAVSSDPKELTVVGDTLYFSGFAPNNQRQLHELMVTGTVRRVSGPLALDPYDLTEYDGELYFGATGGNGQTELYKTDGATISVVKNLSGGASSNPANLTVMNGLLYFTATSDTGQTELYVSDGTAGGTVRVRNLYGEGTNAAPSDLTVVGNMLFFVATIEDGDRELHMSDGTYAGTTIVKNIADTVLSSNPSSLVEYGNELYFTASGGNNQRELWKSDGTLAGTEVVANLSGLISSSPNQLTVSGGDLFFVATTANAQQELHKHDGTSTVLVKNLSGSVNSSPQELTDLDGLLMFSAVGGDGERELYSSDGTSIGTNRLKDIGGTVSSNPADLTAIQSTLYFAATTTAGTELYVSDGTQAGTKIVKNFSGDPSPSEFVEFETFSLPSAQPGVVGSTVSRDVDIGNATQAAVGNGPILDGESSQESTHTSQTAAAARDDVGGGHPPGCTCQGCAGTVDNSTLAGNHIVGDGHNHSSHHLRLDLFSGGHPPGCSCGGCLAPLGVASQDKGYVIVEDFALGGASLLKPDSPSSARVSLVDSIFAEDEDEDRPRSHADNFRLP